MRGTNFYETSLWESMGMRHPGGREGTKELAGKLDFLGNNMEKNLLNLCCGNGQNMDIFRNAGYEITGIDISNVFINQAKERFPKELWIQGDARNLPFCDNAFSCILSECSLSRFQTQKKQVLKEAARVLKKGGLFLVCDVIRREQEAQAQWKRAFEMEGFRCLCWEIHQEWMDEFVSRLLWEGATAYGKWICKECGSFKGKEKLAYVLAVYRRC